MNVRTDKITANEWQVLTLVAGGVTTGPALATAAGRSPEGLHQTAASCVRKGWLYREARPTRYSLTNAGHARLAQG